MGLTNWNPYVVGVTWAGVTMGQIGGFDILAWMAGN